MSVQTSIAKPAAARAGMNARPAHPHAMVTRVADESGGIAFGLYVSRDGDDDKVDLPAAAADVGTGGVALIDPTKEPSASGYDNGDVVSVMTEGCVWVAVEDAVTQGGDVFVRHTAGGSGVGSFRSDDDAGDASKLADAKYMSSAGAGELALLYLRPAYDAQLVTLTVKIPDISTADEVYIASPVAGEVLRVDSVIDGTIAASDAALTTKIGGTNITGGGITVTASGSAAGDTDSATPTAAKTVAAGDALSVETDGASTNSVECTVTFTIQT